MRKSQWGSYPDPLMDPDGSAMALRARQTIQNSTVGPGIVLKSVEASSGDVDSSLSGHSRDKKNMMAAKIGVKKKRVKIMIRRRRIGHAPGKLTSRDYVFYPS
ncbi:hypothetical protein PG991_003021 [Apiospora marii]|uniref:Uncharacterized protein n=1 Tax=Apiospora marii TaxID=335849 RepID=A0ABR1SH27_9PEZI